MKCVGVGGAIMQKTRTKYIYVYLQAYDGWQEYSKSHGFC